ncbi:DUF998 domain-containing protein [Micromonospora lupini]|uniref:DUF998 domain-containing protein n=1 Tax=Micromonospora lupini str. Lupac 08 TaxID=1150864 RepID=I0KW44_9ACTN|nr:DUF998 domain-containing protein [Micromonospora lupini]CCH15791.1 conserved membrane hypothetical protein [Micromonospora lupini str. Lupac 08]
MTEQMTTTASTVLTCDPAVRVTKSLLAYGVIAGPLYVAVSLVEVFTRSGFDPTRHAWSMLSNGDRGWIHITNFLVSGLLTIVFAVGLRRALASGPGARWAPRLIGAYGVSLIAAGLLRADPGLGFPVGTPDGPGAISWHGYGHFASGAIGFSCLIAACFVLARRFAAEGAAGWAWSSRVVGVVFGAGFLGVTAGAGAAWSILAFTAAVLLISGWQAAVAVDRYRRVSRH